MTKFPEPDPDIAAEIRALRHDGLYAGRNVPWDEVRKRIKHLLLVRRPSPDERIELLELYDHLVTRVERRSRGDVALLRRLGHQRAADTLMFPCAEAREPGGPSFAAVIDREIAAGRLRVDRYLSEALDLFLRALGPRGHAPPGVGEDGAAFSFPWAQPPTRQPAFSVIAAKNSGS